MKKLIFGVMAGLVILSSLLFSPLTSTSASGNDTTEKFTPSGIQDLDIGVLVSTLQKVESEITDEDTLRYYKLLIESYDLLKLSADVNDSPLTEFLPDIDHVVKTAMTLPLQEAGKNIRDKDIAEFYQKFLKDAGWEIDS